MAIRFINILILSSLFVTNDCFSQENNSIKLYEITLDTISLNNARYVLKNFGKVNTRKSWIENFDDYSRKFTEIKYDSIEVLFYTNRTGSIFTYWIKVNGSNHLLKINNYKFKVNENVNKLKETYPEIYMDYLNYLKKNKNINEIIYFGKPILIINKYNKEESYLGSLKFGIIKGIITEILLDLRTEGDFD
jgi:hypothetical protein